MSRLSTVDGIATMLKESRLESGKTQKFMAKSLGKSIGTIQNWESGYGTPGLVEIIEWFESIGINPLRYILNFIHPDKFKDLCEATSIPDLKFSLNDYINQIASDDEVRKISFNVFENTGSSWYSQINMLTALNHLPLHYRVLIAQQIYDAYSICDSTDKLINPDCVKPDIEDLKNAIIKGRESAMKGHNGYIY